MGLLKQARPAFNSIQELKDYIVSKHEALKFWSSLKSIDTTELTARLNEEISEAKQLLANWK